MNQLLTKFKLHQSGRIQLKEEFDKVHGSLTNLIDGPRRFLIFPKMPFDTKPYMGTVSQYIFNISRKRGFFDPNAFGGARIEGEIKGTDSMTELIYSVSVKKSPLLYGMPLVGLIWLLMCSTIFTRELNASAIGALLFVTLLAGIIGLMYYQLLRAQLKYIKNKFERDIIKEIIK